MSLIKIANLSEIQEQKILSKFTNYGMIAITKLNGNVIVFQDECTHDGAPFDDAQLDVSQNQVICPRHGARFCLQTGEAKKPPAYVPIQIYKVIIKNDEVFIEVES